MTRKHYISFSVTEEEKAEIEEYCRRKKRWLTPSNLARDAVWQHMTRNPVFKKRAKKRPKVVGHRGFSGDVRDLLKWEFGSLSCRMVSK